MRQCSNSSTVTFTCSSFLCEFFCFSFLPFAFMFAYCVVWCVCIAYILRQRLSAFHIENVIKLTLNPFVSLWFRVVDVYVKCSHVCCAIARCLAAIQRPVFTRNCSRWRTLTMATNWSGCFAISTQCARSAMSISWSCIAWRSCFCEAKSSILSLLCVFRHLWLYKSRTCCKQKTEEKRNSVASSWSFFSCANYLFIFAKMNLIQTHMREVVSLRAMVLRACLSIVVGWCWVAIKSEGSLFNIQQNGDENKERQRIPHNPRVHTLTDAPIAVPKNKTTNNWIDIQRMFFFSNLIKSI